VCVETGRIGHDPESAAFEVVVLFPHHRLRLLERSAVRRDACDGHDLGPVLGHEPPELLAALTKLGGAELRRPGRGSVGHVRDTDAPAQKVGPIVVGHPLAPVDRPGDDAGHRQRRIEAIAGVREVRLRGGGPEPGVDPDEQQLQIGTDEIGNGGVSEGLEFVSAEAHGR